jgi:hypothetical protein
VSSDRRPSGEGLSLRMLIVAGTASAVAAFVVPMFWERGTVVAAAVTPVIIALVSEMLKRPVEAVSAVRVRRTPSGTAILDPPEPPPRAADEPFDPLAPVPTEELEVLADEPPTPRRVHQRRRPLTGRQWKIALATGLAAFFAAAAVVTASELTLFDDAVSSGDGRTTFFGGSSRAEEPTPAPEATATAEPEETAEPEGTPGPAEETPTPAPTDTPAAPTATPGPGGTPAPAAPGEAQTPAP